MPVRTRTADVQCGGTDVAGVTGPSRVPSPTSSTKLYWFRIRSREVKTKRNTGFLTTTGRDPLIKEDFLSSQTGPPFLAGNFAEPGALAVMLAELGTPAGALVVMDAGIATDALQGPRSSTH